MFFDFFTKSEQTVEAHSGIVSLERSGVLAEELLFILSSLLYQLEGSVPEAWSVHRENAEVRVFREPVLSPIRTTNTTLKDSFHFSAPYIPTHCLKDCCVCFLDACYINWLMAVICMIRMWCCVRNPPRAQLAYEILSACHWSRAETFPASIGAHHTFSCADWIVVVL